MRRISLVVVGALGLLACSAVVRGELCVKCRDMVFTADVGKCVACDGECGSGAFKLCKACSAKLRQCESCRAALGGGPAPVAQGDTRPASPPATQPAGKTDANAARLIVDAWSVDHEWEHVTDEVMNVIRSKKVLFGSRSWGLSIGTLIGAKDKKYALPWDSRPGRVNDKDRLLEANALDQPKILHYVFDAVPRRWVYLDDFLRKDPWKFGGKIDGAFQFLYCGQGKECKQFEDEYFPILDKLVADYPKVKFAVATHHVSGEGNTPTGFKDANSAWNIAGEDYSAAVIKKYYGKLPILDLRDIVSTHPDGKPCTFVYNGRTYRKMCPEYIIKNGDQIHPNSPEGRERMGKGFILILAKMFCPEKFPPQPAAPLPEVLRQKK
jgi:hypothetical protein